MSSSDEAAQDAAHRARMVALKQKQDAEVRARTQRKGLLLVHTGDGKGKSTAGFGLALRAAGNGMRVAVVQFTKGSWKTGEGAALARFPEIDHFVVGDGFTWDTQNRQADIASARAGFALVEELIEQCRATPPKYGLLVLDELCIVLGHGYLSLEHVIASLRARPPGLHVCVTGRGAPAELIELADTVTEMRLVKHAYDAGIEAQRGIEF